MSNKQNNSNQGSVFSTLQSFREPMTQVDVEIRPSELFGDAAKYAIQSAKRIFRDSHNAPIVEEVVLRKYFVDALVHRISVSRGQYLDPTLKLRARSYPLPAVVYNAIRQIGEAKDVTYNVKFLPTLDPSVLSQYGSYDLGFLSTSTLEKIRELENSPVSGKKEDKELTLIGKVVKMILGDESVRGEVAVEVVDSRAYKLLSDDQFDACVNMMRAMEEEGYVVSEMLSRDVYGDINVMAMTNVENVTMGPKSLKGQSPVYAFYRSFFYNKQLESLLDNVFTYRYNTMSEMSMVLKDITISNKSIGTLSEVMSEFR